MSARQEPPVVLPGLNPMKGDESQMPRTVQLNAIHDRRSKAAAHFNY